MYQIAPVEGGDCRLIVKHDLRDFEHNKDKAAAVQVEGNVLYTNINSNVLSNTVINFCK